MAQSALHDSSINDIPLSELDPSVQQRFVDETQWQVFDRFRAEAPIYYHTKSQYGPYWSITRYKDIMDVEMNHKVFSNDASVGGIWIKEMPQDVIRKSFITADPPVHDEQRKVVNPIVSPFNLKRLEEEIRHEICEVLDGLPIDEEFDLVPRVSVEVTGRVLARLMDFPMEDRLLLTEWSDLVNLDLASQTEIKDEYDKLARMKPCIEYFKRLYDERKNLPPQHDLISMLAHSPATSDMEPQQFFGMMVLLMVGGNDTTRNSISGGVAALNEFPEEYAKLRANPELVDKMVPEIIRWVTPVAHMRRTAVADINFKGHDIKKGDKVILWYLSGNRDEDMIPEPYHFRVDRDNPRQHVAFGFGIHRCLGNRLAEMQLRILWQELLSRGLTVESLSRPVRRFSNFVVGIDSLPVILRRT